MKKKIVLLFSLMFLITALGCGSTMAQKPSYGKAEDFSLTDLNGKTFKLSDYSGKVIMVNFFATWCPPCRMEMPDFNQIQRENADTVKVIAVNVGNESPGVVQKFVKDNALTFTVAMDDGKVSRLYGPIPGIPVTVVIDTDFNIARRYVGLRSKDVFENDIRALRK